MLGHFGDDLAGEIRANSGDESGRTHRARLQDVRRGGRCDPIHTPAATVDGGIEKGELPILICRYSTAWL